MLSILLLILLTCIACTHELMIQKCTHVLIGASSRGSLFVNENIQMIMYSNQYQYRLPVSSRICSNRAIGQLCAASDDTMIEFLPSKKQARLIENKNLIDFAKMNDIKIDWSCRKGECKKCTVTYNKQQVLACKTKIKAIEGVSKIQVIVPKAAAA